MFLANFFAKSGNLAAYELYSQTHFFMAVLCIVVIAAALYITARCKKLNVIKITRFCACLLWILEIVKIVFNLAIGNADQPNAYIPLYFCSIPLYASVMSGWGQKTAKKIGDVFLVVGGMVGGIAYLISPNTTAGIYPALHFITMQSFLLHSIMIYLSFLYILSGHYKLMLSDWRYYAATVTVMCIIAYVVNIILGSNLMFVSRNFPGTVIEFVYQFSPSYFPILMTLIQAIPPFFVVYALMKMYKK